MSKKILRQKGLTRNTDLYFDADFIKNRLDDGTIKLGELNFNGSILTTVDTNTNITIKTTGTGQLLIDSNASPSDPNSLVNKSYVDNTVSESATALKVKNPVNVVDTIGLVDAYTVNGSGIGKTLVKTTFGALPNIDGIVMQVGDRILLTNEPSASDNGIYTVTQLGDNLSIPWVITRASDADTSEEVVNGIYTFVLEGSSNLGKGYALNTSQDPFIVDTHSQTWNLFNESLGIATHLRSYQIENTVPTNNKILQFNSTSNNWEIENGFVIDSGNNIYGGINAGANINIGSGNIKHVLIGTNAGNAINGTNGEEEDIIIGYNAGGSATNVFYSTLIGVGAGITATGGANHIILGYNAGSSIAGGNYHIIIGDAAGQTMNGGNGCIIMGWNAGQDMNGGIFDTICIGTQSGKVNVASNNIFTGAYSGLRNTTGSNNAFIGYQSGDYNTTGQNNTCFGYFSDHGNNGSNNVCIGYQAGSKPATSTCIDNVYIGYQAGQKGSGATSTCTANVYIGYQVGSGHDSTNKLLIGNNSTNALIVGDFTNNNIAFGATSNTVNFNSGDGVVHLKNGTAPSAGSGDNGGYLYAKNGELYWMRSNGTEVLLS